MKMTPSSSSDSDQSVITSSYYFVFFLTVILQGFFPQLLPGQVSLEWVAYYNGPENGGDIAYGLGLDRDQNVIVSGSSFGKGANSDIATVKYSPEGNQMWSACYNGSASGSDLACDLAVDRNNSVYITGKTLETDIDFVTVKYDSSGNELWVAQHGGAGKDEDFAFELELYEIGSRTYVLVTGRSEGSGTKYDYSTVKYDEFGHMIWEARYDGPFNLDDHPTDMVVDQLGNVYVTGFSGGSYIADYATVKYSPNGNEQWVARYEPSIVGYDQAQAITVDEAGNVYVTGNSEDDGTDYDIATIKYNPNGSPIWTRRYNGPGNHKDQGNDIIVDQSGNVYVTGGSIGHDLNWDYVTIKYNADGLEEWIVRWDGPLGGEQDRANAIALDRAGDIYVTGYCGNWSGHAIATIKYSSYGRELWTEIYQGTEYGRDWGYNIIVDNSNNVYVTGTSYNVGSSGDYVVLKYRQDPPKKYPHFYIPQRVK